MSIPPEDYIDRSKSKVDGKWRAWKQLSDLELGLISLEFHLEHPDRYVYHEWIILAVHKDKMECLRQAKKALQKHRKKTKKK